MNVFTHFQRCPGVSLVSGRFLAMSLALVSCWAVPAEASLWSNSTVPGTPQELSDTASVTLGLKFRSDVAGTVSAVRFYKGSANTGTHIGELWSESGAKLASVTFANETASGWQTAVFRTPVSISANTTYVLSYLAPRGAYADDENYNWSYVSASPLHVSGSTPGVYAYGGSSQFPNQSWHSSNYWVDLVFTPAGGATTYSISGQVAGSTAALTLSGTATASVHTDATGKYAFAGLVNGPYLVAPSQPGRVFNPATSAATVKNGNITGLNFTSSPAAAAHSVVLSWNGSNSGDVSGYRVYRSPVSGGPFALLDSALVSGTSYTDTSVSAGRTYYYVMTAVNGSDAESGYSNQVTAAIPAP